MLFWQLADAQEVLAVQAAPLGRDVEEVHFWLKQRPDLHCWSLRQVALRSAFARQVPLSQYCVEAHCVCRREGKS